MGLKADRVEKVQNLAYLITAAYLHQHNTVLCIKENVQEISGGSAGDSKIEDHEGRCLGLKGINSFPA